MKHQKELFEFLCQLIHLHIQKYVSFATTGIGPDPRLNSRLVLDEIDELLNITEWLIEYIEKPGQDEPDNPEYFQWQNDSESDNSDYFTWLLNQVKFYVEQEHLRAYAGWLMQENNIHTPNLKRLEEQLEQLKRIAQSAGIDCSLASRPMTFIQKQCEYDSCVFAFYILDLAKKVKENPEMEFDDTIPLHARHALKHNAKTRYCLEEFAKPIESLHKKYADFLNHSELEMSSNVLPKENAMLYEAPHKKRLQRLMDRYQIIEPDSKPFKSNTSWYQPDEHIGQKNKPESLYASQNLMLFGKSVIVTVLATCMLFMYFMQQTNKNSYNFMPE